MAPLRPVEPETSSPEVAASAVPSAAEALDWAALTRAALVLGASAVVLFVAALIAASVVEGGGVSVVFSDWFAHGRWNGRSINFASKGVGFAPVTPALWAGLWALLAAVAYGFWPQTKDTRAHLAPWLLLLVVPWLALDLRWQFELNNKHASSVARYGDKTLEEKWAANSDGAVWRQVAAVKAALPSSTERVLVLRGSGGDSATGYRRARALYHLLPLDVRAVGVGELGMEPALLKTSSYLATLEPIAGVRLDVRSGVLSLPNGLTAPAEQVLAENGATLYRLN